MSRFKSTLVAVAASFPGLLASVAFAETTEIKPSVTPYGVIQTKFHVVNTERQTVPDSELYIARIGFKATYGLAVSQIELGANPSSCENVKSITQDATNKISESVNCVPNSRLTVRRADAGLNVKVSDMATLAVSFGRIRPGGVGGWGVDVTNTPENFSFVDGMRLGVNADLGAGNSVAFGVVYGNSMLPVHNGGDYNSAALINDGLANKTDKSTVIGLDATVANVKVSAYYGMEKNAVIPGSKFGKTAGFLTPCALATCTATQVADYTHLEAGLGYDMGNIAGGVFTYQHSYGEAKPVIGNEGGKLELGDKTVDARKVSSVGFGVAGDSTLFGVQSLLQKDDKLTYGASYVATTDGWNTAQTEKINQMAIGVGYATGGLTLELDVASTKSDQESFSNSKGDEKKKAKTEGYLAATFVF